MLKFFLGKTMYISIEKSRLVIKQNRSWWQKKTAHTFQEVTLTNDAKEFTQKIWSHYFAQLMNGVNLTSTRCKIDISDQFLLYFMVSPASNTRRLQDCRDVAQSRFQDLYGEDTRDWKIEADWQSAHPFIACALPRPLYEAIKVFGKSYRLGILSIKPNALTYCNQIRNELNEGDWVLNLTDDHIFLACVKHNRLCFLHNTWLPQHASVEEQWLHRLCDQVSLRQNISVGQQFFTNIQLPPNWKLGFNTKIITLKPKTNTHTLSISESENEVM